MGRVRLGTAARAVAWGIAIASLGIGASRAIAGSTGCPGDCNDDHVVLVNELVLGVNIALGVQPVSVCVAMDLNHDDRVTVDELIRGVRAAISGIGCPDVATPTGSATVASATATATTTPVDTATRTAAVSSPPATPSVTATLAATMTATAIATATHTAAATITKTPPASPTHTQVSTATDTPPATATSQVSGTPTATTSPIANPTGLTAIVDGEVVQLAWTPPNPLSGNTFALVLRRLNAAVDGPDDAAATTIFFGEDHVAADAVAHLLPDVPSASRTYHYAVYGCTGPGQCEHTGSAATLSPTLVQALRAGGYTLHWRHSSATVCEDQVCLGTASTTLFPNWWKSCDAACPPSVGEPAPGMCPNHTGTATARQLNADGIAEATAIGQAFDALAIPIGRVMSSEFCRNVTTAALMDFGPPIELVPGITYFVYNDPQRCRRAYELIDEVPAGATNTAIIGHSGFVTDCPVLNELAWSEVAIFKPDGEGAENFITRVTWEKWPAMVVAGPTGLQAAIEGSAVHLTWTAPDPTSGFTTVRLLRRLNADVAGPNDPSATLLFSGSGTSFDDDLESLLPNTPNTPRTYHYAVYGCAGGRCETVGSGTTFTRTDG